MALIRIEDLAAAASVAGTESVELSTGQRATLQQIANLASGGGGGSGNVVGPATSNNNYPALFDGTTGKLLKQGTAALGTAAYSASGAFATAAQGAKADSAVQPGSLAPIATSGAVGALTGFPGGTANFLRADGTFAAPPAGLSDAPTDGGTYARKDGAWSPASRVTAAHGAFSQLMVVEELLTMTGASVTSGIVIPNRAIVLGVSCRTVANITGATSYACGISGETSKFGSLLSVTAGGTNMGVIGPQAFYADTPILITPAGGNFTGGSVRIAIHYLANQPSTS